ncbi:MAG: hypothetical protein WA941_09305 [Nitrososphaeraceae archaeon]
MKSSLGSSSDDRPTFDIIQENKEGGYGYLASSQQDFEYIKYDAEFD